MAIRTDKSLQPYLQADARRAAASIRTGAREGNRGTTLTPARPAHTPKTGSSAKPLPDLTPPYDRRADPYLHARYQLRRKPEKALDNKVGAVIGSGGK
jgi:hypothetical protein